MTFGLSLVETFIFIEDPNNVQLSSHSQHIIRINHYHWWIQGYSVFEFGYGADIVIETGLGRETNMVGIG